MTYRNAKTNTPESARSFDGATCTTEKGVALFEKRQFRAYREFSGSTVIKLVTAKPFFLIFQRLWTGQGAARAVITTGGTEGGTFTAMPTSFCLNTTEGGVTGNVALTVGGTHTGGTEREVLRCDSSTSGGGSGSSDTVVNQRYLAAGTYYIEIGVTGTTSGMYSLEWEDTL